MRRPLIIAAALSLVGALVAGRAVRRQAGMTGAVSRTCAPPDSGAALRIQVRDAATRQPLPDAEVHTTVLGWDTTDSTGVACLDDVEPGDQIVFAMRPGFAPESAAATARAGRRVGVEIHLHRAAPPCCRLDGVWHLRVDMERTGGASPVAASRTTEGIVVFSTRLPFPMPWPGRAVDSLTGVRWEAAQTSLDLTTLFGAPAAPDVSTTVFGGGGEIIFRELIGMVIAGDSVGLVLIPRISHGGLSLVGRVAGDTIRGTWLQSAYCCGATGRFVMARTAATPRSDSLVTRALVAYDHMEREAARESVEWAARAGRIRLRVYDEATRRYVKAGFWAEWLAPGAQEPAFITLSSEEDGWGERPAEPGRYRLRLADFPCGRLTYFADSTYVRTRLPRLEFTLEPREVVERELRIDSRAIVPTSSYDNGDARQCAQ